MSHVLRDLYAHQAWADAEHWRAFTAHGAALDDSALRQRLHHIHLVQRLFLAVVSGVAQPPITRVEDFPDFAELKDQARTYHTDVLAYVGALDSNALAAPVTMPWFVEPPLRINREEALLQCAMHSHYHRGQNATRLRELGGDPPNTDLIVWYWKNRPAPRWD